MNTIKTNSAYLTLKKKATIGGEAEYRYIYNGIKLRIVQLDTHWICFKGWRLIDTNKIEEYHLGSFRSFKKALKCLEDKYVSNSIKFICQ